MKQLEGFFSILTYETRGEMIDTQIEFDAEHIVYKGHFPGFPVTPGVIQLKIVHDLLEKHLGQKIKLQKVSNAKFLNIINPEKTPRIHIHIELKREGELIKIKASGKTETTNYFNLRAIYQVA